jgi:hypothetical protein
MAIETGNGTMRMLKTISVVLSGLVTLGVLMGMIVGYFDYISDVAIIKRDVQSISTKLDKLQNLSDRVTFIEYLHKINLSKSDEGTNNVQTK